MSRHFKEKETRCRCGCGLDLLESFKEQLDLFRDHMGFPMFLISGARCEAHNKAEKGSDDSYHMKLRAGDIDWERLDGTIKARMLDYAVRNFNGIGLSKKFLHVDDRPIPTIWFYK